MFVRFLKLHDPEQLFRLPVEIDQSPAAPNSASMAEHLVHVTEDRDAETAEFRWKLGHQITSLLFSFAVRDAAILEREKNSYALQSRISSYLKACNALFQYTASVDADTYQRCLRPKMAQHHPSFSARWWKEARKFREAAYPLQESSPQIFEQIAEFWKLHKQTGIKMGLSSSLRQDYGVKNEDFSRFDPYFDSFFLIERSPEGEQTLFLQLSFRRELLKLDIDAYGIGPDHHFQGHSREALLDILDAAIDCAKLSARHFLESDSKLVGNA